MGIGSGSGGTTGDEAVGVGDTVASGVIVGDGETVAELVGDANELGSDDAVGVGVPS